MAAIKRGPGRGDYFEMTQKKWEEGIFTTPPGAKSLPAERSLPINPRKPSAQRSLSILAAKKIVRYPDYAAATEWGITDYAFFFSLQKRKHPFHIDVKSQRKILINDGVL